MSEDEAKNKIYGICNSLNAIAEYFTNSGFYKYAYLLEKAQNIILEGIEDENIDRL